MVMVDREEEERGDWGGRWKRTRGGTGTGCELSCRCLGGRPTAGC